MKDENGFKITRLIQKLKIERIKVTKLRQKMKIKQQRVRRLQSKVNSLKELIDTLKKNHLISDHAQEKLEGKFSGISDEIFRRLRKQKKSGSGLKYSPVLKSFALTLQFYSSKAYNFVRKMFNLALPHPNVISKWYSKIPAEPGFTEPAFKALSIKVDEAKKQDKMVLTSLMLDEMSIKKHVAWDHTRFRGYIDVGDGCSDDDTEVATDALVFMVVSLDGSFKVPIAYFFIKGMSGKEKANLVLIAIEKLAGIGVNVVSLTCDGPSAHFAMMRELGASLDPNSMKTFFTSNSKKIYVFLDICHMLKLVRNILNKHVLIDEDGNQICWRFIGELAKLQEREGLRLGNKLRMAHVNFEQQKMKVNLAAQALSSSVATAIEYCDKQLKLPQFKDSEATVKFIRTIDSLFDILNSKNPFAKGYKCALKPDNCHVWGPFLEQSYSYLSKLKNVIGTPIYKTKQKTGFVGFMAAIPSTKGLFSDLVAQSDSQLKYLLMYKFSQDHLELFFGGIRAAGGSNNNPTAQQFVGIYKRMLLRSSIGGNIKYMYKNIRARCARSFLLLQRAPAFSQCSK